MRACRARTVGLLPLLFPFSMLGRALVTARASRCETAAPFAGEHRNPPHLKESWRLSRMPDPFTQKSSRFVARVILTRNCRRLCKIAQIDTAWGVDMQAIVSAICAHAVHELRPLRWSLHRDKPGTRGFTISQSPASTTTADSSKFAGTGP